MECKLWKCITVVDIFVGLKKCITVKGDVADVDTFCKCEKCITVKGDFAEVENVSPSKCITVRHPVEHFLKTKLECIIGEHRDC